MPDPDDEFKDFLPPDPAALQPGAEEMPAGPAADPTGESGGLRAVLDRHHDALMARAGVVMVGETRDATGAPAILVGVRASRDLSRLPTRVDDVPLVCQVVGQIDAY